MECPYCGAQNRPGVHFCSNCGHPLNPVSSVQSASSGTGTSTPASAGANSRALTPGSRLQGGRYVIKKVLGQGGMGAAMLATDLRLDSKPVVIKELISDSSDPAQQQEDVRNFKREVALLAHIDHPLVPTVTDHFQEGSRYFMVQEYVEGENLEERMDRINQPMKEREVLEYASEVLDILDYLSQQTPPIVHRDIKPANIIIGAKDKRAHLVDFGIARADVARNARRKQTSALGTPGYAPPEQYQGNADPRSDLYALGATMHHLLTNRDPRNHPPFTYPPVRTLNPQLSQDVERVIARAMINDINQRYQSAAAMKRDVDDILLKRFGVSPNAGSYTLGTSGQMSATPAPPASAGSPTGAQTVLSKPAPQPQVQQQVPPPPQRVAPPPPPVGGWQGTPYQPAGMINQPPPRRKSHVVRNLLLLLLVLLLIGGTLFAVSYIRSRTSTQHSAATPTTVTGSGNGIGATKAPDGELIGISDGTVAFDIHRPDGPDKINAAKALQGGNTASAESLWQAALNLPDESNDAEALIYLEDQNVLNAHSNNGTPYITIVVSTMLTGANASVGRDDLQGAYVAQKEFNDGAKLANGTLVRLLIANSGSSSNYAKTVANQIVQLAHSDPTFVGVMGWPFSSYTFAAVKILQQAHIVMVSQTASSDLLSGVSLYFFRVAPPNTAQGVAGAKYAEQVLQVHKAALFLDPSDPYSETLASDFSKQFRADGNTVFDEDYTVGTSGHAALPQLLQSALNRNPDMIYFSGYAADVSVLLTDLPTSGQFATIPVLGGDALYELGGYTSSAGAADRHLRFTSFAFPDEWDNQHLTAQKPHFFAEYPADFDPARQHSTGAYGYDRPDGDVMLSYDAMLALLDGSNTLLSSHESLTGSNLRKALLAINGTHAIQGVSGQISFGSNGDPINKAFVVLFIDANGYIKMQSVQGCFLVGKC